MGTLDVSKPEPKMKHLSAFLLAPSPNIRVAASRLIVENLYFWAKSKIHFKSNDQSFVLSKTIDKYKEKVTNLKGFLYILTYLISDCSNRVNGTVAMVTDAVQSLVFFLNDWSYLLTVIGYLHTKGKVATSSPKKEHTNWSLSLLILIIYYVLCRVK